MTKTVPIIDADSTKALSLGHHGDPFSVLGLHELGDGDLVVRAMRPEADCVDVIDAKSGKKVVSLEKVADAHGVFAARVSRRKKRFDYKFRLFRGDDSWEEHDAYGFGPRIGDLDEHLVSEGTHGRLWSVLGAHVGEHEGVWGTHFAVWAPNATRVSVVGDF